MRIKLFEDFEDDDDYSEYIPNVDAQMASLDEINRYVNDYLVYLKEDGFEVNVNESLLYTDILLIQIYKKEERDNGHGYVQKPFKWEEAQDYIIPFAELVNEKYNLHKYITLDDGKNKIYGKRSERVINKTIEQLSDVSNELILTEIRLTIANVSEYKN